MKLIRCYIENFGGLHQYTVDFNEGLTDEFLRTVNADSLLVHFAPFKTELNASSFECVVSKLAYRMLYSCGNDKVFGFGLLKNKPHAFYVVLCITPVAQRGKVA